MSATPDALKLAVAAYSRGDLIAAKAHGEAALRAQPGCPSALQTVGTIYCHAGDTALGAGYIRKAIALGADTADNRFNLARALLDLGELKEAADLCRAPNAGSRDLQRLHADVLKAQGCLAEAIAVYERLVAGQPDDFHSWNNLGNARHEAGDLDAALAALQKARDLNPKSPIAHINIGRLLVSLSRYEEACLSLEKGALLAPTDPTPLLELGRILTSIDHPASALKALGAAARLNPQNPEIFLAIGVAFTDLADPQQAERAYRIALRTDPTFAPAYLHLGILLEKANRLNELEKLIGQARAAIIGGGEIDYLHALFLSRNGRLEEALEILRSVQSQPILPGIVAHSVGQVADKLNRIDEAFAAFETMNGAAAQSRLGIVTDRAAYQRGVEELALQTTQEWFSSWPQTGAENDHTAPAFLVGFPRSGTTLLDTILMGHSGTHVLEEVPILETVAQTVDGLSRLGELRPDEIAQKRTLYYAELDRISPPRPGQLVIDKSPLSMIRIPLIQRLFPDAKIIFALRHPCDVVLSCFMQNFKVTESTAGFLDLMNASLTYDRILSYWEQCREIFPVRVHSIRYEDLISDTEAQMRSLLKFLDLPWEESVLNHKQTAAERGYIVTPSYAQVTEGLYARASGRWVRYRRQMTDVLPVLEPWVAKFGYSLDNCEYY